MKSYSAFEKVLVCLTVVFIFIIAYNKIINISNIKTIETTDSKPLTFTKTSENTSISDDSSVSKNKDNPLKNAVQPITPININTATVEQLTQINGVGDVLAQRIVDFRTQNNSFKSLEELMLIKGIGESTFEKLKPYVCLQ